MLLGGFNIIGQGTFCFKVARDGVGFLAMVLSLSFWDDFSLRKSYSSFLLVFHPRKENYLSENLLVSRPNYFWDTVFFRVTYIFLANS